MICDKRLLRSSLADHSPPTDHAQAKLSGLISARYTGEKIRGNVAVITGGTVTWNKQLSASLALVVRSFYSEVLASFTVWL